MEAYQRAHACDPVSAYGGVMAFNRPVSDDVVTAIFENKQFVECIIAPEFSQAALDMYAAKKHARMSTGGGEPGRRGSGVPCRRGRRLFQDADAVQENPAEFTVPTKRKPTEAEMDELMFAWKACKSVKSNAILIAKDHASVGAGGGQPNRVNSARIAVEQAGEKAQGAVAASDAFFASARVRTRPMPASPPSSSRAAPSATKRSSRPRTSRAWPWCSPATATSATRQVCAGLRPAQPIEGEARNPLAPCALSLACEARFGRAAGIRCTGTLSLPDTPTDDVCVPG